MRELYATVVDLCAALADGSYWKDPQWQNALDYGETAGREPPIDTSYGD